MRPGHLDRNRPRPTGHMFEFAMPAMRAAALLAVMALTSCAGTPPPWVRNANDANPCGAVSCPHGMHCDPSGHCEADSPR